MKAIGIGKLWFRPVDEPDAEWKEIEGGGKIELESGYDTITEVYCGTPILDPKRSYSLSFDIGIPSLGLSRAQKRHLRRKYGRKHWRHRYYFEQIGRRIL